VQHLLDYQTPRRRREVFWKDFLLLAVAIIAPLVDLGPYPVDDFSAARIGKFSN
jgi:hypothetical protein